MMLKVEKENIEEQTEWIKAHFHFFLILKCSSKKCQKMSRQPRHEGINLQQKEEEEEEQF